GKNFVKVHPEVLKMIKTSIEYSKLSGGAFDISVGPLINLWKIGTPEARIPSQAEINAALPLVGCDKISINEKDSSVMLQKEGMSVDLGGIAKGFTADEVFSIYKKFGIKSALINLGGSSIYGLGTKPDGSSWSVGVQHPRKERNQSYLGIIKIASQAVSTSGDYERYFEQNGKRYHHILDPHTGYPADTGVMSDTIVVEGNEPDCSMKADLLTTTVFVLGPQKGLQFIDKISNIECFITTTDMKLYTSAGYRNDISNLDPSFTLVPEKSAK
ncbi:MAG: FAD:protein FMN transferase, partial [Bacillota bacterium]|nr:FAD:protein FMN transferase [Bacillota bacterium]